MFGFAWLTLRQAREALKAGRLEEAQRLLNQSAAQGHKRSWELLHQVARGYVERGERHLRQDNAEAAWGDLLLAEQVGNSDSGAGRLRQSLVRLGLIQAHTCLEAGEPLRAADVLAHLRLRGVVHPEALPLEETAQAWLLARDLAERGEFNQALDYLAKAARLLSAPAVALAKFRATVQARHQTVVPLLGRLHEAAEKGRWRDVLELSEQILAAAPEHTEARKVRGLAWKALEPATVGERPTLQPQPTAPAELADSPTRYLLWIDGVGGYLICPGSRILIGQATLEATVDVPLFADVSRLHASITRDAEGYLLHALRPVQVNGRMVDQALLQANDRITLGGSCQLQFRQPSPLSHSARLDLVSGHRLSVAVEAVLLMADTLLLGPDAQAHVSLPDVQKPVVLFRHRDGLGLRYAGKLTVNGKVCQERALLNTPASVTGDDFAFALELAGPRLGRT
jgi:tetratricopeptide (TPR) repeat protein